MAELLRDRFGRDPFAGETEAELRAADAVGMTDPFAGMTGAQPGAQPGPAGLILVSSFSRPAAQPWRTNGPGSPRTGRTLIPMNRSQW